jgi:hypothetical protein
MTTASITAHDAWTIFWDRLFPVRRPAPARRPAAAHANGDRQLAAMSPHELADLPAWHEAA